MAVSLKKHFATEKRDLDYCMKNYSNHERGADVLIRKLKLDKSMKLLEIGAAQGSLLIALSKRGYDCEALNPLIMHLKSRKSYRQK